MTELAQVQGVLRVMEIHGAALLAEEMHQVTHYLQATAGEQKNQAEALDALMRAMVQLPGYLDRVLAGGRDLALVLLPLLNDMRAVRGSPLLSEGTLLLLNLKSEKQPSPEPPAAGEEGISVAQWARRSRSRFQLGMIGWIRGERSTAPGNAGRRGQALSRSRPQPLFQLWWVIDWWSRHCASAEGRQRVDQALTPGRPRTEAAVRAASHAAAESPVEL
jgi:chemosensory pili system protein ChpA (sensor histidine kinase/response regulator)